jgi:hypothetical protein
MSKDMQMSETPVSYVLSGASGMLGTALRRVLEARAMPVLQLVRRPPAVSQRRVPSLSNPTPSPTGGIRKKA